MTTKKTAAPGEQTDPVETPPADAPDATAPATPWPTAGGCYVRQPDGTLTRED